MSDLFDLRLGSLFDIRVIAEPLDSVCFRMTTLACLHLSLEQQMGISWPLQVLESPCNLDRFSSKSKQLIRHLTFVGNSVSLKVRTIDPEPHPTTTKP